MARRNTRNRNNDKHVTIEFGFFTWLTVAAIGSAVVQTMRSKHMAAVEISKAQAVSATSAAPVSAASAALPTHAS